MLIVGLLCLTASTQAVFNPSFEIDENPADGIPDRWSLWGSSWSWGGDSIEEYIFDDPDGAHTGSAYFRGYAPGSDYACTVPREQDGRRALIPLGPQDTCLVGVWVKDLLPDGQSECSLANSAKSAP